MRRFSVSLLILLAGMGARVEGQQRSLVRINYVDANLPEVIRSLAAALDVNVVLTGVPDKKLTFQTPQPVPVSEVGAVLEAILESEGFIGHVGGAHQFSV